MSKYVLMDWDLVNPIADNLRGYQFKKINLADAGALVRKALNDQTVPPPPRPGQLPPFCVVRIEIDFQPQGPLKPEDEDLIVNDPLLHQRIIDAVQTPLLRKAQMIADEIKRWDADVAPSPTLRVQNIKNHILQGQQEAAARINPLMMQFKREKEGYAEYSWNMKVNLIVGTVALTAAVVSLIFSGGSTAAVIVPSAVAGARGVLDLAKSFRDLLIGTERLQKNLEDGMVYVRNEAKKGWMAVKVLLGGTIKLPAIGYTWGGSAKWASVADLKDDCELYENKLMEIRDTVHSLAREVPKLMEQIKNEKGAAKKMQEFKWRGKEFEDKSKTMMLLRTQKEQKLHELLEKIIEFEKGWRTSKRGKGADHVWDWQSRLDGVKGFKTQLDQALSAKGIENYDIWEKSLDFAVNLFLATYNFGTGVAEFKAPVQNYEDVLSDVAMVVGSFCDLYGLTEQGTTTGSSKFES